MFSSVISPKKFLFISTKCFPWLIAFFILFFIYGLVGGLYLAPPDYIQGEGFRIIYVHVPCAFLSLFIYAFMAACAAIGLIYRLKLAFSVMRQSIAIGAWFTLLTLITGSLWGKPMWGTWWIWDARLTSELILFFLYLGILLFQSAVQDKKSSEQVVAILVLVGFVDIPIIHYSVYWWNTLHQGQTLNLFSPSTISKSMCYPLLAMIVAFLIYYFIILTMRIKYELITSNKHWIAR